jgi:S1-C subfamily serine protease
MLEHFGRYLMRLDGRKFPLTVVLLTLVLFGAWGHHTLPRLEAAERPETAIETRPALPVAVPSSVSDLATLQQRMQTLSQSVIHATVAVQVGAAQGSGVIVSPDGYVLTAAHVAGKPGRTAILVLHDGRRVRGQTLGVFRTMDAGLIKINDEARPSSGSAWHYAIMGKSEDLKPGQWCLATGHPGGHESAPTPVVRVGRILTIDQNSAITTDCTLIGGDSGGPLFDLQGRVIGVHSRIGGSLKLNLHVPVTTYRVSWERLAAGDAWGYVPGNRPFIGVQGESNSNAAKVAAVIEGTPAEKAGLRVGDLISRFAGKQVTSFESLQELVESQEPGATVEMEVLRGDRRIRLEITVGRRE